MSLHRIGRLVLQDRLGLLQFRLLQVSSLASILSPSLAETLQSHKRYKKPQIMASSSSLDREKPKDDVLQDGHIEHAGSLVDTVDDVTEKKLLRKLDYRIIPMIMWSKLSLASIQRHDC